MSFPRKRESRKRHHFRYGFTIHMKYCTCRDSMFGGFTFNDLRDVSPPKRKGVYVIVVRKRGRKLEDIIKKAKCVIKSLKWPLIEKKALNRISRLSRIDRCSVIYIGSAGTRAESRHTLLGRYKDFAGRHTVMIPIWLLIHSGWQLEYGWKTSPHPDVLESKLKLLYMDRHNGHLPALVSR